ncbi:MAG: thymidylate synthase (FAD) [Firmicutes bacterium HGW-Firmicutes-1]|jgi:thymidylate synthase (FAD)|nr:MAG: thymidylate synthase (FAD) [Firmicutes bacterium HGW-Firmicutes-1]
MPVKVISTNQNAETIVAASARISTTKGSALEIFNRQNPIDKDRDLIKKVLQLGHNSLIEHAIFNLAFEDVSAFVEQFMIEFRLASFTVKSRRYVEFTDMGYNIPNFDKYDAEFKSKYINHMDMLFGLYGDMVNEGIPKEDARFILPYGFKSNFYCTVNAREATLIIKRALNSRYNEIIEIGNSLLEQLNSIYPSIINKETIYKEGIKKINKDSIKKEFDNISYENIECELCSYTQNPEEIIAIAEMLNETVMSYREMKTLVSNNETYKMELINRAVKKEKKRELEQITFTFNISNISLAGLTHLVRHRMQSIIIPDLLTTFDKMKFIMPDTIRQNKKILEKYKNALEQHKQIISFLVDNNIDESDLIYLCLSGNLIDVMTTMNYRELLHFLELRSCFRAQWEIQELSLSIIRLLKDNFKILGKFAGPSCYTGGICREGKFSCGKAKEIKNLIDGVDE